MQMTLFGNRESIDYPWGDLAIDIHKILTLVPPPTQSLTNRKDLHDRYDTFKQFGKMMNTVRLAGCSECH